VSNELNLDVLRLISPELSPTTALPVSFQSAMHEVLKHRGPAILQSLEATGPERLADFPGLEQVISNLRNEAEKPS